VDRLLDFLGTPKRRHCAPRPGAARRCCHGSTRSWRGRPPLHRDQQRRAGRPGYGDRMADAIARLPAFEPSSAATASRTTARCRRWWTGAGRAHAHARTPAVAIVDFGGQDPRRPGDPPRVRGARSRAGRPRGVALHNGWLWAGSQRGFTPPGRLSERWRGRTRWRRSCALRLARPCS
jgi:hypothetical protein